MTTRPNNPSSARRWRKKRMRAYDHWLRTLNWSPASKVVSRPAMGASASPSIVAVTGVTSLASPGCETVGSVIADARVEEAVGDVRDQVEDDDDDRRHEEGGHHRVEIQVVEALHEEVADAVEREDGLRDDRAPEQAADVERCDRRDGNQRVAEDVAHDHPPLRHALSASGAHVVAVDHVEHRGP